MLVDELAVKVGRASECGEADEPAGCKDQPHRVVASVSAQPESKGREDSEEPEAPHSPCISPNLPKIVLCRLSELVVSGFFFERQIERVIF